MEVSRRDTLPLLATGLAATAGGAARAQYAAADPAVPIKAHLGVTENPFGPSPAARLAIRHSVRDAAYYPHSEKPLLDRIVAREGIRAEQVTLASGSLDALSHLSVGLGRGGRILAPQPTYSTHLAYAARQGVETDWVPLGRDHQIDLAAMLAAIGPQTRLVYLCNPNNPTGLLLDPAALHAFCIEASKRVPVMIDEAYFELAPDPLRHSVANLVREGHDVIVARTFSKVYGLAGFRIAYILAQPERVRLLKSLVTTSRNQAGLAAATVCLGDAAYLAGAIAYLKDCRSRIYRIAEDNKLVFLPSEGTFVYLNCGMPGKDMQARLARLGVEVRLFEGAAYANWIRIGTAIPAELAHFAAALPKALAAAG
ncbi:histidinol-phosphate transaminase [uncultured Sphingomonas sp.]|uniref:pyridoxal phosphate-dependent aminotransferase n=1 Tax=uncultured Sphingomonas sp. TaxID=158754 RepID=UPI0025E78C60|nr:histidinol-phosphate transaminase [uncultured Sphingomonas sp.]